MNPLIAQANLLLGSLTVAAQVAVVLIGAGLLYRAVSGRPVAALDALAPHAWLLAFSVALIATLGSLFYSEIAQYEPCKLCWFQRIFMYPLPIIIGMALATRERTIRPYVLTLASLGGIIAAYHYYIQLGGVSLFPCSAIGYSASCSGRFVMTFGYITIPMMALSAFLLITVLMSLSRRVG